RSHRIRRSFGMGRNASASAQTECADRTYQYPGNLRHQAVDRRDCGRRRCVVDKTKSAVSQTDHYGHPGPRTIRHSLFGNDVADESSGSSHDVAKTLSTLNRSHCRGIVAGTALHGKWGHAGNGLHTNANIAPFAVTFCVCRTVPEQVLAFE